MGSLKKCHTLQVNIGGNKMGRLDSKIAIITGGGSGMGKATRWTMEILLDKGAVEL